MIPTRRLSARFSWKRVLVALAAVFTFVLAQGLRYYGHYHPFADLVGGTAKMGAPPASLRVTDAVVTGRDGGRVRWRIKAQSIALSQDRSQVTVQGIHDGVFLGPTGKPLFSLQAEQAVYQKPFGISLMDTPNRIRSGFVTVGGGIEGRALQAGGPTLSSDTVTWDIAQNEVRSFGHTQARFPPGQQPIGGLTIQAPTLVWDTTKGTLAAPGTVTATFADGAGDVEGSNIVVDTKQGTLTLRNLHGTFRVAPTVN